MMASNHFYHIGSGAPCYEVIGVTTGTRRSPTMGDAKKGLKFGKELVGGKLADHPLKGQWQVEPYGIVPSVTTVQKAMGVGNSLCRWLMQQAAMAAATLPQQPGETDEAWMKRVLDREAWTESRKAADLGTDCHNAIETALHEVQNGSSMTREIARLQDAEIGPYVVEALRWLAEHIKGVCRVEHSFACGEYGGKIDLIAETDDGLAIIDWKTQSSNDPKAWPEHGEQIAAYSDGVYTQYDCRVCLNVYISTTRPGVIKVHDWGDKIEKYRRMWRCKMDYFKLVNDWSPITARIKNRARDAVGDFMGRNTA